MEEEEATRKRALKNTMDRSPINQIEKGPSLSSFLKIIFKVD